MSDGDISDDQHARITAEEGQRRLSYLYQATTTLFVEPLDFARRLRVLTRLLIPDLGDWCWIDLVTGGVMKRALTHHWDATRLLSHPDGPSDHDADRSITIPIRDSEGVIGQLTLRFVESNRRYRPEDIELATELVTRGAWALDAARQYERATRATTAREDILAVVAHDLRNPLATVLMASSILKQSEIGDENLRMVERISRAGDRMEKLVKDLLDWAAIESGRLAVDRSNVTVGTLIDEVSELFAVPVGDPRVVIEQPANELEKVELWCDQSRTSQVFSNLVGNAIKFAPKGSEIRVSAELEPRMVRFVVEDHGPGIAAEHLTHIFERYWQVESGTAQRRGVGLGLAITNGIVAAQGGTVGVTSELGKGSRFSFTVPRLAP
jgi:signal transduction histidine kinase